MVVDYLIVTEQKLFPEKLASPCINKHGGFIGNIVWDTIYTVQFVKFITFLTSLKRNVKESKAMQCKLNNFI